jgi:hypothetical protein
MVCTMTFNSENKAGTVKCTIHQTLTGVTRPSWMTKNSEGRCVCYYIDKNIAVVRVNVRKPARQWSLTRADMSNIDRNPQPMPITLVHFAVYWESNRRVSSESKFEIQAPSEVNLKTSKAVCPLKLRACTSAP